MTGCHGRVRLARDYYVRVFANDYSVDLATDEPSQLHCPAPFANDPINEVLRNRLW